MPVRRVLVAVCTTILVCAAAASAQRPPDFDTLVDAGPVAAPDCRCIGSPFTLPTFRPAPGYGGMGGAATPLIDSPPSPLDWQRYAAERKTIGPEAEAALAGNPHASASVAVHLSTPPGDAADPKTEEEAVRWLHLAARQGHPTAFMLLGYRYREGRGVTRSDEAAAYWFFRDADSGSNVGKVALGLLYAAGRGVPQDFAAAVYWWRKAESHPVASRLLGDAYVCGLGGDADKTRAVRAYTKASYAGDATASMQLGHMYANGCAGADDGAATKAYKRAAEQGYPDAQVTLSEWLRTGRDGPFIPGEAYHWARIAEWRLPSSPLRDRAAAAAKAAARSMSAPELEAEDQMIRGMIVESAKPMR